MRFAFIIIGFAFALGIFAGVMIEPAVAPSVSANPINTGLNQIQLQVNIPSAGQDVRQSIIEVVNFLLSFLALIAVIVIIIAGFVLIFGMGSEASVARARKIIIYTIVGLIIIFFAQVIVFFFTKEIANL